MDLRKTLAVDAVVLVVYALAANPAVTGVPLHEWLGMGALAVVVAHAAMHADYLLDTFLSAAHRRGMRFAKAVLDMALVLAFMVCCVSGLMVSGEVLPALGLYAEGYYFWSPLHAAYERFAAEHALVWMPRFAEKTALEARLPFYRAVAQLLATFGKCKG